jgi:protein TonB
MLKRTSLALLSAVFVYAASAQAFAAAPVPLLVARRAHASATSDREQDGLAGPVRRVKTETAKIAVKNGKPVEGARAVLETTTYDQKGNRVDNAYFLEAGGTLTGKEVYKYDDKGNIVEMTLRNEDGSLLAKEVYGYEFDAVGNWVKMTTSVAIIEGGKLTFEPSEVTYRTISYFLDEGMLSKMSQPASPTTTAATQPASNASAQPTAVQPQPTASNSNTPSSVASAQPKPSPVASSSSAKPTQQAASQQQVVSQQQQSAAKTPDKSSANKAVPVVLASVDKSLTATPNAAVPVSNAAADSGGPIVKADTEAPAAPPVRTGPLKPVSGGILNGKAFSLPAPTYPEMAKRARASGLVEVEVVIDITGKVISAKATKGQALLLLAAEQAAKQARFTPTLLSGQPVRITGVITYNFTLSQ